MNDESPLIQAVKGKMPKVSSSDDLLAYILSHFDLVPKEDGQEEQGPIDVQTQESHVP